MENEYMKRGYLLPQGCKDLSDVAKLKHKHEVLMSVLPHKFTFYNPASKKPAPPLPPVKRQIFVSAPMTVKKLAALLGQNPFQIIGDLMQLGVWATVESIIDFNASSLVAKMHGFEAIRTG